MHSTRGIKSYDTPRGLIAVCVQKEEQTCLLTQTRGKAELQFESGLPANNTDAFPAGCAIANSALKSLCRLQSLWAAPFDVTVRQSWQCQSIAHC